MCPSVHAVVMEFEEREIRYFLRGHPGQFVSPREIARRVGGRKRYHDDPSWPLPILSKMLDNGIVETDAQGHYRLKRKAPKDGRRRIWVSPQMKQILTRSSSDFGKVINLDDEEEELL